MSSSPAAPATTGWRPRLDPTAAQFAEWAPKFEVIGDVIDQMIDLMLNHRQSGHPGGSRSKIPVLVTTLLSGAMRWDLRHPEKRFGDKFVLVAGHCNPAVYATLAVFNEALRFMHAKTGDARYAHPLGEKFTLLPKDLLDLRRNGGLPGHAEMEGKTLFFKFNTGPSGHGSPAAAGEALALKHAGCDDVRVFAVEGEGGMTAGAIHETKNTAYGLGLGTLHYIVDWNDHGIDSHQVSSVVKGTPRDWFEGYGFNVDGTLDGHHYGAIGEAWSRLFARASAATPNMLWVKTRKGRGYGVYDFKSHGTPHAKNSALFWQTKKEFAARHGVEFTGVDQPAPEDGKAFREQTWANINAALDAIRVKRPDVIEFLANRLVEVGDSVPADHPRCNVRADVDPGRDPRVIDVAKLPDDLFAAPGAKQPNRAGFSKYGGYVNAIAQEVAGRPLVIACSADLAESTNIAGFAHGYRDFKGHGWYRRDSNPGGALLPQEITEFTNAGVVAGIAVTNLSPRPFEEFRGYWGACSTYGSFSYLKYGLMRLFSQVAQDSQIKVGRVLWVAGHSGPETAEDSRTHFGIFEPGVTQMFPRGHVINLHPWEHNDVAPCLAAAFATDVPVIALHLTRPAVTIPDRAKLGMDDFRMAAKGLYVAKEWTPGQPKQGTLLVQGTSVVDSMMKLLPKLKESGPNVRVLVISSHELFRLQPRDYQEKLLGWADWQDSTVFSSASRKNMAEWLPNKVAEEYAITPDWDDRWRTGGSVDEIVKESHLDPASLEAGIARFVADREKRLARIRAV
ncbi:MAG: transketolase [Planctomycetes bacterium]|nr:transketolase [Planctomycetota bacterium]